MTSSKLKRWDYALAVQRVGDTPERQLAWLIRFAEGEVSALGRDELRAFLQVRTLQRAGYNPASKSFPLPPGEFRFLHEGIDGISADVVEKIHAELRRQIESLKIAGDAVFNVPSSAILLWRNPYHPVEKSAAEKNPSMTSSLGGVPFQFKPWHMLVVRDPDPLPLFFGEVLEVLLAVGDRLRVCSVETCRAMFVAVRPHQKHCSERCTNRVTQANYRARKGAVALAETRHKQRATKLKREYAARANVPLERVRVTSARKPRQVINPKDPK